MVPDSTRNCVGWSCTEIQCDGLVSSGIVKKAEGKIIGEGIAKLKAEPKKWAGIIYQSNMTGWAEDQQEWTLYQRPCDVRYIPAESGAFTWIASKYQALPPATFMDDVSKTPQMSVSQGRQLEWKRPGRGEGIVDTPGLKLFGDVNPDDIEQGAVGNCWLVSAISALAEFDGEIKSLFSTDELSEEGKYTFKLYDLPGKQWKEIVIDDSLACYDGGLLSLKPTCDDEIWPLLLEKALVVHGGGWDKIKGGQSSMAFVALTGCTDTFTVSNANQGTAAAPVFEKMQPKWDDYEENNCKCPTAKGAEGVEFSEGVKKIGPDEFFDLLCEWDSKNYIVCAGSGEGSGSDTTTTAGIVHAHAYSVISAKKQVCGEFDFLLLRNPHRKTEFEGGWHDGGPKFKKRPDVLQELQHVEDSNDGLFWMEKADVFTHFDTFHVCCKSMDRDKLPKRNEAWEEEMAREKARAQKGLEIAQQQQKEKEQQQKEKEQRVSELQMRAKQNAMDGWIFTETQTSGSCSYSGTLEEVEGKIISEGIAKLKAEPEKWAGILYQSNMTGCAEDQQKWTLYTRAGLDEITYSPDEAGGFTFITAKK